MPTSGSTEKAEEPGKLPRPLSRPLRIAKLVAAVATCGACCVWATSPVSRHWPTQVRVNQAAPR